MKIHKYEYQGKEIFKKYGVPVPRGILATARRSRAGRERTRRADHRREGADPRGRARGRRGQARQGPAEAKAARPRDPRQDAGDAPDRPAGKKVGRSSSRKASTSASELYLGIVVDRATLALIIMARTEGGMEIEEVAGQAPGEDPPRSSIPRSASPFQGRRSRSASAQRRRHGQRVREAPRLALHDRSSAQTASLVEINPLVVTRTDQRASRSTRR